MKLNLGLFCFALCCSLTSFSYATPTGVPYSVNLRFFNLFPGGSSQNHFGSVTFDANPELVPTTASGAATDLIVSESLGTPFGPNNRLLPASIVIDGQDPNAAFPTPGAPLFGGAFGAGPVDLQIQGIYWNQPVLGVLFQNIFGATAPELTISFPTEPDVVISLNNITGQGIASDPLTITGPSLTINDFVSGSELANQLTIGWTMIAVPEPGTLFLAAVSLPLLARRRSD